MYREFNGSLTGFEFSILFCGAWPGHDKANRRKNRKINCLITNEAENLDCRNNEIFQKR